MYKPWGTNLRFRVDNVTQQKLLRLSSGHGVVIYQASGTTNGHQGVQQLGMCAGPGCTTVLKGSSACSKRRECEKQKLHFFEDSFDSSSFCVIFMMFHRILHFPSWIGQRLPSSISQSWLQIRAAPCSKKMEHRRERIPFQWTTHTCFMYGKAPAVLASNCPIT